MKLNIFKLFIIFIISAFLIIPVFSLPPNKKSNQKKNVQLDAISQKKILKNSLQTRMKEEMVIVIPAGKKVDLEDFAETEGIQTINSYMIEKYEITQDLYMAVMGVNPSDYNEQPAEGEVQEKRPVENVSWNDAIYFCNKLSIIMGLTPVYSINGETAPDKWGYIPHQEEEIDSEILCNINVNGFRLPTAAEWEYAARGGAKGGWNYKYSGSDEIDEVAWYECNSDDITHEVGKKNPNALGIYDMSGNVWEWCDDVIYKYNRAIRGGCVGSRDEFCEVICQGYGYSYLRDDSLGFRVARSIQ